MVDEGFGDLEFAEVLRGDVPGVEVGIFGFVVSLFEVVDVIVKLVQEDVGNFRGFCNNDLFLFLSHWKAELSSLRRRMRIAHWVNDKFIYEVTILLFCNKMYYVFYRFKRYLRLGFLRVQVVGLSFALSLHIRADEFESYS